MKNNAKIIEKQRSAGEQGNVLFLILIAVALFAALSYAVTQSSRSGGGDASNETNLINSAQITQYPSGVRTSIIRMMVSGGKTVDDITFNVPSDFGSISGSEGNNAFHPTGGGATYVQAPGDVMASGSAGTWYFNGNFEVENIGTSVATSPDGNEITAFLPGVANSICQKINSELGITTTDASGIPEYAVAATEYEDSKLQGDTIPASETELDTELSGQPFGCFRSTTTSTNVYYHVLIER